MSLSDNENRSTGSVPPGLTITATPIGNLGDLSPRARASLEVADIIACEDTRHTGLMLSRLGIKAGKLVAYHDHSSPQVTARLLAAMEDGSRITLVSDAGTPLIADPGFQLVRGCRERGISVTTIPGPSAMLAGLTLAGLPTDRFFFGGFLASGMKAREKELTEHLKIPATLIFYDSPKRVLDTLALLERLAADRPIAMAREITKLHEECRTGTPGEVLASYQDEPPPRGEIVLIIGPSAGPAAPDDDRLRAMLQRALADGNSRRDAADLVSKASGVARRKVYSLALEINADDT
ncbi:MAG: 16S rRNA (cytidine(1402)-2'-O)-methyltransferase [Candidatus Puniceispirillales bacterium]